jgi:hypothetical protein
MADLEHSKRNMERATYTPIKPVREHKPDQPGRALDKWGYAAALSPTRAEFARVKRRLTQGSDAVPPAQRKHLDKLEAVFIAQEDKQSAAAILENIPALKDMPGSLLLRVGEELRKIREGNLKDGLSVLETISAAHDKATIAGTAEPRPPRVKIPAGFALDVTFFNPELPGAKLYLKEGKPTPVTAATAAAKAKAARIKPAPDAKGIRQHASAMLVMPETHVPSAPPVTVSLTIDQLAQWALGKKLNVEQVGQTLEIARQMSLDTAKASLTEYRAMAGTSMTMLHDINHYIAQRLGIEPVGLLHLERLSFIPAGIERGELIHSVPLSPAEEVNISHKEWSNTSEEFEQIVTDYIESYSEEGVTEKSEIAQSTNSQQQHSSGFNLGVTASGSYGPVSISTTVGYNVANSASSTETTAKNHSSEMTRKASSRVKKEHKTSFKVASASGTEDQAVRLIKNPFPDKATRVDYYQLVRKWRVDLYRYGVRLTYDITIPEPGSDILSKILEIQALTAALSEGFGSPSSTLPWARFDLAPDGITRNNYLTYAAQYGAVVDPPPADSYNIVKSFTHQWENKDAAKKDEYITFDVDVPAEYQVNGWGYSWERWAWEDESWHFTIRTDFNSWVGVSGTLTLVIGTRYCSAFDFELTLGLGLRDAAYKAWKLKVWGTLREAAEARYELNRTMLKDQLSKLLEELGAQDALSLRKIEREEVMKGVLRWLFGPSFNFVVPGLPPDLYGSSGSIISDAVWSSVLAQGELIKFLHQAIEWENMLYFLYPYFWSHTSRWEFKKYLDHPDFMHRVFLKSGSARVVLTIRPGFETDFVSFLETGTLDGLPPTHPYMTIAEEMQAYANTNYPGIRSANPVDDARPLLSPLQKRAWGQMEGIIKLLEQYRTANGAYPTTAQGLAALSGLGTVPPKDPWGNDWAYRSPGQYSDFELVCLGADGAAGGEGEDADIVSWADASLVGRWYEYTPTSALDISFNETLPTA